MAVGLWLSVITGPRRGTDRKARSAGQCTADRPVNIYVPQGLVILVMVFLMKMMIRPCK